MNSRTRFLAVVLFAATAALGLVGPASAADGKLLRVGYQKYGTLIILKQTGGLEKALAPLGYRVEWKEFPAGPQLLEALNVGALDAGTTGETPPIFAQAAGAPLVYIGHEPAAPDGEALLVPKDSKIASIADLKGKKIALNKGSNVHYLLVKALEAHGLKLTDIQSVYLAPADARAAFESGTIDAWVIWDPYQASAEIGLGARKLTDGVGLVQNYQYYLATRDFAARNRDAIKVLLSTIDRTDQWAAAHVDEVANLLSPEVGLPVPVLKASLGRLSYGVKEPTPEIFRYQQQIADTFSGLGLIPKAIKISDAELEQ
ncbi:MAG: sulfonate ABC transporter substrate-binding protein [Alphaproteobacteria bacterium]|nr:sulfonate ABC transporter substrate-binding protein [Alphaproteobacteria bacterium]